jgi:hypothetical protein
MRLDGYTRDRYPLRMPTEDRVNLVLDQAHRELVDAIAQKLTQEDSERWSKSEVVRLAIRNLAERLGVSPIRKKIRAGT